MTFVFILLAILFCAISGWLIVDPDSPLNRASAIRAAQDWACLDDLPKTATDIEIATTGSAFTREFTISFKDTPANISTWIAASPGPASANPSTNPLGWHVYEYPACDDAVFAEVRVSPTGDQVVIHTYWS